SRLPAAQPRSAVQAHGLGRPQAGPTGVRSAARQMICEVVFDLPRRAPFSYAVPPGVALHRGQRVSAPLHGRSRIGIVVDLRDADAAGLKPIERPVESAPVLSAAALELGRWAAAESLSSWGSTLLSLLPPLPGRAADVVAPPPEPRAEPAV